MILVGSSLSLGKMAKEKNALCDKKQKINQLLTSQNTAKNNSELGDKIDQLHMGINRLKGF